MAVIRERGDDAHRMHARERTSREEAHTKAVEEQRVAKRDGGAQAKHRLAAHDGNAHGVDAKASGVDVQREIEDEGAWGGHCICARCVDGSVGICEALDGRNVAPRSGCQFEKEKEEEE